MKLYTRKEFLGLPAGVVFAKEDGSLDEWLIKGDTIGTNDFRYQHFIEINSDLHDDYYDALLDLRSTRTANADFYDWRRDGLYDTGSFAVLDRSEVVGLIARLQETLEEGYV